MRNFSSSFQLHAMRPEQPNQGIFVVIVFECVGFMVSRVTPADKPPRARQKKIQELFSIDNNHGL